MYELTSFRPAFNAFNLVGINPSLKILLFYAQSSAQPDYGNLYGYIPCPDPQNGLVSKICKSAAAPLPGHYSEQWGSLIKW